MMSGHRSRLRRARAFMARVGYVLALGLLVLGLVQGGTRYFYCPIMNATFSSPCCEAGGLRSKEHAADQDGPSASAPECCKLKRLGAIPFASPSRPETHQEAPDVVAVVPDFADAATASCPAVRTGVARPPARAGPQSAHRRRAELMIWNC